MPTTPATPATPATPQGVRPGLQSRRSVERSPRWVRVKFGGEIIADTRQALFFRQYPPGGLPAYYFPLADVRADARPPSSLEPRADGIVRWTVQVGDRIAENAAWMHLAPSPDLAALEGHVGFEWDRMDAWYEEDEEVFVHARDPRTRVDVLQNSRHVRVEIGGQIVVETRRPAVLFETDLPTRYYIPRDDVRMELLEPTNLTTRCPYKGIASYWTANVAGAVSRNVVWSYPDPIPECPKIRGLLCFFNERVSLHVDGQLQPRPKTMWSE